ncbi:hypothetical protein QOZ80_1BG0072480 [Eleusine coracana subsp. coracana]|nr:hypothetical protein QOZ80_1BG0072480 [Eleusine coracana subsp. coracana]
MAMTPSALPNWALLDLREDESFPTNESTTASSAISRSDKIRVCFEFDHPPRPSRVFLWVDSSRSRPSLDLIPAIEGTVHELSELYESDRFSVTQRVRRRGGVGIAVLRCGQDFAVGELEIPQDTAQLNVYKSSVSRWETTTRPKILSHSDADMGHVQWYWQTDHSFAFGNYLCWVDYCIGGMFLCKVLDEDLVLEYLTLPATLLDVDRDYHGRMPSCYHSIGVDEDHGLLKFVMIARDDGKFVEHKLSEHDCSNIKVASWTLKMTDKKCELAETVKPSDLLRDQGLGKLPCTGLWLPVVSRADMGTVFFMCNVQKVEEGGHPRESFLVAISMNWNTVLLAIPHTNQEVDDPHAEKLSFETLVSIELPKYLNLEGTSSQRQGPVGTESMGSGRCA